MREELGGFQPLRGGLAGGDGQSLWCARLWSTKDRAAYEKMISKQACRRTRAFRREDPNSVACPHRLTFAWSGDSCLDLEAKNLAMVCTCENLSDWAGPAGRQLGGSVGRATYVHLQAELSTAWLALTAQVARNKHVVTVAPAIAAIFELVEVFLERRYQRYATVLLAGRLREEVLANVARQHEEMHAYFEAFNRSLTNRCRRQDYAEQARYASDRYLGVSSCQVCTNWMAPLDLSERFECQRLCVPRQRQRR